MRGFSAGGRSEPACGDRRGAWRRLLRRAFLPAPLLLLLSLALGCGGSDAPPGTPRSPGPFPALDPFPAPQGILLITADDLGWKDLGCYGNDEIRTPNIDRLAAEGVRFDNAFVTASSCSSSRASLLTGQYPHTHGVDGLTNRYPEKSLPPDTPTLASCLRDAGFVTALQGKWHEAPFNDPRRYGYEHRLSNILEQQIPDSRQATRFLRDNRDRRFFLQLNYMNTHRGIVGEFRFDPDFPVDPEALAVPAYWHLPDWPEILLELAMYYSQTRRMDAMVGEVLAVLDELGLAETTLVVFLSDNGAPFPGNKMTLYDRGIGTPLLVRFPAGIRPGSVVPHLVSMVDILPTVIEALGCEPPGDPQGRSLLPLLKGTDPEAARDAVFAEMTYHVHYLPIRAIRTPRWKYIRNYSEDPFGLDQCQHMDWARRLVELPDQPWTQPRVPEELYDLDLDPDEQRNLAGDPTHARILEPLRNRLDEHMRSTLDPYLDRPLP